MHCNTFYLAIIICYILFYFHGCRNKMSRILTEEEILSIVESISDNQALDSDIGGDSDADDSLPIHIVASQKSSTRSDSSALSLLDDISSSTPSSSSSAKHSPRPKRFCTNNFQNFLEANGGDEEYDSDADPEYHCDFPKNSAPTCGDYIISSSSSDEDESTNSSDPLSDLKWSKPNRAPVAFSLFNFNEKSGPKVVLDDNTPLNCFRLFLSVLFSKHVVQQKILYAAQKGVTLDLTFEEFNAFLGILLIMGINVLPSMRMYWSSNINLQHTRISNIYRQRIKWKD